MIKLELGKYYLDKSDFAKLQYTGKRNGVEIFLVCALDDTTLALSTRHYDPSALNIVEYDLKDKAWRILYLSVNLTEEINALIFKEKNPEKRKVAIYRAALTALRETYELGETCKND